MSKIYTSNILGKDIYLIATKNTHWLLPDIGFYAISPAASLAKLNAFVAINSSKLFGLH